MRDLMHTEEAEGFTIRFYAEPEDMDPADSFEFAEDIAAVRNGDVLWFQVECAAYREGVKLGSDYLGGCAYKTYADFLEPGGYADDMRAEAIREARAVIAKLCAEA